jgi:glutamate dehydrogenase
VARGGIRWSDRREDFRTEILGLMKAQMVKNTVIVPVGAKGGFVVKDPPDGTDREAVMAEGVACYRTLIRGLLDVTDNRIGDAVVPPADVVRADDDDPYLVVAADKGTATFSDIANAVAADYGFWLGDAFASGGSVGYDHKKMGITARGAWVSVQRHFRDLGRDIRNEAFTAIGIGDMAGDVFGNGMLLAPNMRLLAAFNHAHIFVDPDPDPATSFAERRRLFGLPRSSWTDYDPKALSAGGGVFDRGAKSLVVSPEIRARFGFTNERMTPVELIRRLLTADVDLLWLGGIGTFVKAAHESNADAGDRANDAIRVDSSDLRCKVIGEGANLGVTQLGRVAFALAGGRINTDFIDNSAGVDCSDHEVNIKILLDAAVADGDMTESQRNRLLADMTDEVADLVLRDNFLQTQAIGVIEAEGAAALEGQGRLIRFLERHGGLHRAVEALPDDEALAERAAARQALTRPEIAVVFSHVKIWLYDQILASDLPDDPHLAADLLRYFPSAIGERFRERVFDHRLKRELVATAVTNSVVNRVGGRFVTGLAEKTGRSPADVARAYLAARAVYAVRGLWDGIEALDYVVPSAMQATLFCRVRSLLERSTLWFLRHGGSPLDIAAVVAEFGEPVSALADDIGTLVPAGVAARLEEQAAGHRRHGVPDDLARRLAGLEVLPAACDVVRLGAAHGRAVDTVARLHFAVGERFGFDWLRSRAEALPGAGYWHRLAAAALVDDLDLHQRRVTDHVLVVARAGDGVDAIDAWARHRKPVLDRLSGLMAELDAAGALDLAMLTVVGRELAVLAAA